MKKKIVLLLLYISFTFSLYAVEVPKTWTDNNLVKVQEDEPEFLFTVNIDNFTSDAAALFFELEFNTVLFELKSVDPGYVLLENNITTARQDYDTGLELIISAMKEGITGSGNLVTLSFSRKNSVSSYGKVKLKVSAYTFSSNPITISNNEFTVMVYKGTGFTLSDHDRSGGINSDDLKEFLFRF